MHRCVRLRQRGSSSAGSALAQPHPCSAPRCCVPAGGGGGGGGARHGGQQDSRVPPRPRLLEALCRGGQAREGVHGYNAGAGRNACAVQLAQPDQGGLQRLRVIVCVCARARLPSRCWQPPAGHGPRWASAHACVCAAAQACQLRAGPSCASAAWLHLQLRPRSGTRRVLVRVAHQDAAPVRVPQISSR